MSKKSVQRADTSYNLMYQRYILKKMYVMVSLFVLLLFACVFAIKAGSTDLNLYNIIKTLLGKGTEVSRLVILRIRLPRVVAAIIAGAGLSVAGCVMQNNLRNPLASPSTLGISNAAAFGANLAIIIFGAGSVQSSRSDAVIINNPYMVTIFALVGAMAATLIIILLTRLRGFSPESMVLAGVALSSLFSAGTMLIQYFAQDVQIAAAVFWTFGDLGRIAWNEIAIMTLLVVLAFVYFLFHRWDYNALDNGEDTTKSLGINIERIRMGGMFVASLITSVTVSFLGIIGFIGLVGPQIMRRTIGGDHRYLIPASALAGSLLLLIADTLARTIVSPVVLPVGAITSFFGAPLFLYLLIRGGRNK